MSHERLNNDKTKEYTAQSDYNLLQGWSANGSDWTSAIREECLALTNQPIEKGKSGSTRGIVLLGTLATLALLGVASLTKAPVTSQIPQENVQAASAK